MLTPEHSTQTLDKLHPPSPSCEPVISGRVHPLPRKIMHLTLDQILFWLILPSQQYSWVPRFKLQFVFLQPVVTLSWTSPIKCPVFSLWVLSVQFLIQIYDIVNDTLTFNSHDLWLDFLLWDICILENLQPFLESSQFEILMWMGVPHPMFKQSSNSHDKST